MLLIVLFIILTSSNTSCQNIDFTSSDVFQVGGLECNEMLRMAGSLTAMPLVKSLSCNFDGSSSCDGISTIPSTSEHATESVCLSQQNVAFVDIGWTVREWATEEGHRIDSGYQCASGLVSTSVLQIKIAVNPIIFFIQKNGHLSNCITSLTTAQVAQLFASPSSFTSSCNDIKISGPDSTTETYSYFTKTVTESISTEYQGYVDDAEAVRMVSQDSFSIGYAGTAFAKPYLERGELQEVEVVASDYGQPIYMNVPSPETNPRVLAFAEFALSTKGQDLIDNIGYRSLQNNPQQLLQAKSQLLSVTPSETEDDFQVSSAVCILILIMAILALILTCVSAGFLIQNKDAFRGSSPLYLVFVLNGAFFLIVSALVEVLDIEKFLCVFNIFLFHQGCAFIAGALVVKIWSVADLFESGSTLEEKAVPVFQIPNMVFIKRMIVIQMFVFMYLIGFVFLEKTDDIGGQNGATSLCFSQAPYMIIGIHAFETFTMFLTVIVAFDQSQRLQGDAPNARFAMLSLVILHVLFFSFLFPLSMSDNIRAFLFAFVKLCIAVSPQIFLIGGKYCMVRREDSLNLPYSPRSSSGTPRSNIVTYRQTSYGSKRFVQSPIDLEMEDVYDLLDIDQKGVISAAQFQAVARRAGLRHTLDLFDQICAEREFDDRKRLMTKDEFAAFWNRDEPEYGSVKEKLSAYVLHGHTERVVSPQDREDRGSITANLKLDALDFFVEKESSLPPSQQNSITPSGRATDLESRDSNVSLMEKNFDGFAKQWDSTEISAISVESRDPVE